MNESLTHDRAATYAPDLSIEGIERIEAALNAAGVWTHYSSTDGESYLDIQLRDLDDESPLALSWRVDGWEIAEYPNNERADAVRWRVDAASLEQVAAEVASIVNEIDEPDDTPQQTGIPALDTWAAANGWTWGYDYHRWTNPEQTTAIGYDDGEVKVWRKTPGAVVWPQYSTPYPVDPERAVDLLVALRILPDTLHSLHSQVATVAELTDELRRVRERLADERAAHARGSKNFDAMERLNSELHMQAQVQRQRADRYRDRHDEAAKELSNERVKVMRLAEVRVWRNEDGKEFMFADDVRAALDLPHPVDERTCAHPGDHEHDHAMCEDVVAERAETDRRCRRCGATTGLAMLPHNPLTLAPREWECADGYHKGGAR